MDNFVARSAKRRPYFVRLAHRWDRNAASCVGITVRGRRSGMDCRNPG